MTSTSSRRISRNNPRIAISHALAFGNFQGQGQKGLSGSWNRAGYCADISSDSRVYAKITNAKGYKYINPAKITNAVYRTYEGSGTAYSSTIQVYDSKSTAAVSSAAYSNFTDANLGNKISELSITASGWKEFDIKALFQKWLKYELGESGGKAQAYGFVLKGAASATKEKHFSTRSNSSYLSEVKVTYTEDESIANGTYYIKNQKAGKYLDLKPGVAAWLYPFNGTKPQQWKLQKNGDGTYTITTLYNNKALDARYATGATNPVVWDYTPNGTDCQRWRVVKNADGSYRVMGMYQKNDSIGYNGTTLYADMSNFFGDGSQKWTFEKPSTYGNGGSYKSVTGPATNCMGFALFTGGILGPACPIPNKTTVTTEDFIDRVVEFGLSVGPSCSCRHISSQTAAITDQEYRIAFRGKQTNDGAFHVVRQLKDGTWAGKNGTDISRHFVGDDANPSKLDGPMWYNVYLGSIPWKTDYTTNVAYFAMSIPMSIRTSTIYQE